MIALALLLQATAPSAASIAPPRVAEWTALPPLPLGGRLPEGEALSAFVKAEVGAGRCAAPLVDTTGTSHLSVDMAVLVDRTGAVRRMIPRAIACPTVEQYAVGIATRIARGNVTPPAADGWFRLTMPFAWR